MRGIRPDNWSPALQTSTWVLECTQVSLTPSLKRGADVGLCRCQWWGKTWRRCSLSMWSIGHQTCKSNIRLSFIQISGARPADRRNRTCRIIFTIKLISFCKLQGGKDNNNFKGPLRRLRTLLRGQVQSFDGSCRSIASGAPAANGQLSPALAPEPHGQRDVTGVLRVGTWLQSLFGNSQVSNDWKNGESF